MLCAGGKFKFLNITTDGEPANSRALRILMCELPDYPEILAPFISAHFLQMVHMLISSRSISLF